MRVLGVLERPLLPPTVASVPFKLFLWGRAGVGKTSLVTFLSGRPLAPPASTCETPGLRVTDLHWPVKVLLGSRIVLLKLSLWDSGEAAGKKFAHINPVCREGSSGGLLVFSFCDRGSFAEVSSQLDRLAQLGNVAFCPIVVGTRSVRHYNLTVCVVKSLSSPPA